VGRVDVNQPVLINHFEAVVQDQAEFPDRAFRSRNLQGVFEIQPRNAAIVIRCDTERAANNFRRGALAESDSFIESIVLIPVAIDLGVAGFDMLGRDRRGVDRGDGLGDVMPDGMSFQGSSHSIYSISESSSCQGSREPLLLFCREIGDRPLFPRFLISDRSQRLPMGRVRCCLWPGQCLC
jgi:hypothetical protein